MYWEHKKFLWRKLGENEIKWEKVYFKLGKMREKGEKIEGKGEKIERKWEKIFKVWRKCPKNVLVQWEFGSHIPVLFPCMGEATSGGGRGMPLDHINF